MVLDRVIIHPVMLITMISAFLFRICRLLEMNSFAEHNLSRVVWADVT